MNPPGEPIRVLLVDEDADFADMAATILEQNERFVVVTASSAKEGRSHLDEADVDCIVSDYKMPEQNGIEFLEAVRENHPDLPFILFTGKGSEEVASEALSAGATDYLQKRAGTEQYDLLANRIRNAVDQYRSTERTRDLERIRTLISDITQELVHAEAQSVLEQRVCERFTAAEPYRFAWIGEIDEEDDIVWPRTWAGIERGYLDDLEIAIDDSPEGRGPTGEAVKSGTIAVQQNISEDDEYEPWREEAIKRGYQSSAAVPLVRNDIWYGVLNVYANRSYAFDDQERDLLAELGDDIAHALARIENERELHRYEAAVEGATDMLVAADGDRRVLFANEHFRERFGRPVGDLCGTHLREIVGAVEFEELEPLFERSLDGERVQFIRDISTDGDETRILDVHFYPLLKRSGDEITGVVASLRDVTTHELQKRKLREFKQAVDAAGQAIYMTDPAGDITYANRGFEGITGYSPEEAIGRNPRLLKSDKMPDGYFQGLWESITSGDIWDGEVVNRRKNGELYYAHLTVAPVTNDTDDIEAYVAIQTDLTERKEREDHLLALDRMLRHNLNNELNVVLGRASMIEEAGSGNVGDYAEAIIEASNRLLVQATKEREIVRILTEPRTPTSLDLTQLIRSITARLQEEYPAAGFELDLPAELEISTIPEIERAIEELLHNAMVHAADGKPTARIAVTEAEGSIEIEIEDSNPTIPPEERAVLLGDSHIDALTHTSGMGLWLVKRILTRAGGKLTFDSNGSSGNRITVVLPT
ncbi:MAG: PAS domain S-box protein [Halodesulfurarchaeum sp.]|nr:PAS domain S-box protein [Halodesulfurarchaeum sp.]